MKTDFYATYDEIDRLFACNRISAMIWNKILDKAKEYRKKHNGAWISQGQLEKELKNIYPLHSQSVQAVAQRYCDNRQSTKAARDKGYLNVRYPWRYKHAYPTRWKQNIKLIGNKISLPLGMWSGHRQTPIELELPKSSLERLTGAKIQQIDLIWDNRLMLAICYEDGKQAPKTTNPQEPVAAGIDLGEIHSISAATEKGHSIIITGRKLRSVNRFRNKQLAEICSKQSKCKKYSRRWKKLQRAKRYMLHKAEAQVRDCTHKITKNFVDWAIDHNVKHVYCGNPEGVQRNTSKKKPKNRKNPQKLKEPKEAQKLSNWNFGTVMDYLKYKLARKGIGFEKISEAYTTQTCPVCGQEHKCKGRNYVCTCGYTAHRDAHGAMNILSRGINDGKIKFVATLKRPKYLRSA